MMKYYLTHVPIMALCQSAFQSVNHRIDIYSEGFPDALAHGMRGIFDQISTPFRNSLIFELTC